MIKKFERKKEREKEREKGQPISDDKKVNPFFRFGCVESVPFKPVWAVDGREWKSPLQNEGQVSFLFISSF